MRNDDHDKKLAQDIATWLWADIVGYPPISLKKVKVICQSSKFDSYLKKETARIQNAIGADSWTNDQLIGLARKRKRYLL